MINDIQHRAQRSMARAFMAMRGSDQIKAAVKESKPTNGSPKVDIRNKPTKIVDPLQPLING